MTNKDNKPNKPNKPNKFDLNSDNKDNNKVTNKDEFKNEEAIKIYNSKF